MLSKNSCFVIFLFLGLIISGHPLAAAPANGEFIATKTCEAYTSKNRRINPGNVKLKRNQNYTVFEANKAEHASWYRIRVIGAAPPERWVSIRCGTVHLNHKSQAKARPTSKMCHSKGLEDSYKLALSWQPAFCETHRSKPECRINDPQTYEAHHFVLHGLWPNKNGCGIHYQYCGQIRGKPDDFCDYPKLNLSAQTRANIEIFMPSAKAGSCLQRHEWFKHGTCQNRTIDEYFDYAISLTQQFNQSGIAAFMADNTGKTVKLKKFKQVVDQALGEELHQRLTLKCKKNNLVEIMIDLPRLDKTESLSDSMRRKLSRFTSNCGQEFKVDPIGFS